jgi:hypothetical protein
LALVRTEARFPAVEQKAGHYESFYVKATRPGGGQAVWIRHTVHKRPGGELDGSIWFTLFDAEAAGPRATKVTVPAGEVSAGAGSYITVNGASLGDGVARGEAKTPELDASWDLTFEAGPPAFHHLPYSFLYGAPLPRTKLLSPYPNARYSGSVTVDGQRIAVDSWPGMVGHNWGSEHAERWIWMEANEFREADGWFDAGLGRIKIGPLTTPWIGNAMLCIDGVEHRLGGLDRIRSTEVEEEPTECEFELTGKDIRVRGRVGAEARDLVAGVYADPVGPQHNTLNSEIADHERTVERKGEPVTRLECVGAAAYELGTRDTNHGIELQPYPDG